MDKEQIKKFMKEKIHEVTVDIPIEIGWEVQRVMVCEPGGDDLKLTEQDYKDASELLGVDTATIKAVTDVESAGSGFLPFGRPKILFEGHVFWRELKKVGIDPIKLQPMNPDIIYPRWIKHYYKGGEEEWDRLERAQKINDAAALKSASWGLFQIMGFNYRFCGFEDVYGFVAAMKLNEGEHLKAFCKFILSSNTLIEAIRTRDWVRFAKTYNGIGYKANRYDEKLMKAYEKYTTQMLPDGA